MNPKYGAKCRVCLKPRKKLKYAIICQRFADIYGSRKQIYEYALCGNDFNIFGFQWSHIFTKGQ